MNLRKIFGIKNQKMVEKQNSSKNPMNFEEGLKNNRCRKNLKKIEVG